ncbi:MAG: hypothetical protein ACQEQE_11195 [Bacillota bacterium]
MTKREKQLLLDEYKHILVFTSDMSQVEDKKFYEGKKRQLEEILKILDLDYQALKEEIQREYNNLDKEIECFFEKIK